MSARRTIVPVALIAAVTAVGGYALVQGTERLAGTGAPSSRAAWTEVAWPFPVDQWGRGKAFRCGQADCGGGVSLYLRAKLGFCNCTTGIADDDDLDRMGDLEVIGGKAAPLAEGRPVRIGAMNGRQRAYALGGANAPGTSALSVVFNDRCDMVAATVVLPHDRPAKAEAVVLEFLNSATVLRWVETSIGL